MSIKRWKLGLKRCNCVQCESAITFEQTEENCGWVMWEDHKDEVTRLKAEVERLKEQDKSQTGAHRINTTMWKDQVGCLLVQVDNLNKENALLRSEVDLLKGRVNYWRIEAECDHGRWLRCLED